MIFKMTLYNFYLIKMVNPKIKIIAIDEINTLGDFVLRSYNQISIGSDL